MTLPRMGNPGRVRIFIVRLLTLSASPIFLRNDANKMGIKEWKRREMVHVGVFKNMTRLDGEEVAMNRGRDEDRSSVICNSIIQG